METRVRMLFVLAGFPEPVVNVEVFDDSGRLRYRIDLAWPTVKVAVEYDGRHHIRREEQWTYDIRRREDLEGEGWAFLVLTAADIFRTPDQPLTAPRACSPSAAYDSGGAATGATTSRPGRV